MRAIQLATAIIVMGLIVPSTCTSLDPEDDALVRRVNASAAARANPVEAETIVGIKPEMNSNLIDDRFRLARTALTIDLAQAPQPVDKEYSMRIARLKRQATVMYWVRPLDSRHPRVVGITWDRQGNPAVFFGVVYPPR